MRALLLCAVSALLGGCVALGWQFGPGMPCTRGELFAGPPVVVHRGADFYLSWTQGTNPFFYEPGYQARDGRLVFSLVATASSGNLAGQDREMKIEGAENLAALRQGGAVWWEREPEPDGRFVKLEMVEQPPVKAVPSGS